MSRQHIRKLLEKIGLQGRVTVEVTIDAQGKPIQAKVIKSASDVFNEAAIEAVMKYTFKPAMMSTGPVTSKVMIPIDFRLNSLKHISFKIKPKRILFLFLKESFLIVPMKSHSNE